MAALKSPDRSPALRIGVLGCGRLARQVHIPALLGSPDFTIAAVADAARTAADGAAAAAGAPAFLDAGALLSDVELDAILIAAPPAAHAELAVMAFEAGLAVYVEKPLAVTPDEAESIVAAWQASGRAGQIGFNYRYNPTVLAARGLFASGRIGELVAVRSTFTSAPRAQSTWKRSRASGGGALLDLGSHHLDLVPWLVCATPVRVAARFSSRRFEDDTAAVSMHLGPNVPSESLFAIGTHAEDRIELYGTSGKIEVDRLAGTVAVRSGRDGDSRIDRAFHEITAGVENVRSAFRHTAEPSFALALAAFANAIRSGEGATPDLHDGLRSLRLCAAAERAARTGSTIALDVDSSSAREAEGDPPRRPTPESEPRDPSAAASPAPAEPTDADGDAPDLSVVLVTAADWTRIRRTLEHLARQTVRDRIELLVVAPSERELGDVPADLLTGYHAVRRIWAGPIDNVDVAAALGIREATSAVVAMVEDHAFPEPGWAEAIIEAHREPWGIVGSTFTNANPHSLLSWANMLMAYGSWIVPVAGGEIGSVSRHNVSFKRSVLMAYDEELERLLGRDGGLLPRLAADGHRSFLAPGARLAHVNPSRLWSTISLRVNAGRLRAGLRAARGAWPTWRRVVYVVGGPLLPIVLFRGMFHAYFGDGQRDELVPRAIPALMIGTTLDAIGQVVGFALGAGSTAETLAGFELERARHLRRGDRHVLTG